VILPVIVMVLYWKRVLPVVSMKGYSASGSSDDGRYLIAASLPFPAGCWHAEPVYRDGPVRTAMQAAFSRQS
jgi:hypothetical protein